MKKRLMAAVLACLLTAALSANALAAESWSVELTDAPKSMTLEQPYLTQCELGSVVADAARAQTGADLALIETGVLANDLPQGIVTRETVQAVFTEDLPLAAITVSPAELALMLENCVAHIEVDPQTEQIITDSLESQAFCQVSGLTFRYDASAPVGERVLSVWLEDGKTLDLTDTDQQLTLVATQTLLSGTYGHGVWEYQLQEVTLSVALMDYLSAGHTALPEGDTDRISVIGARQNTLVSYIPHGAFIAGVFLLTILLSVFTFRGKRRQAVHQEFEDME